jgi:hypothetical protein
MVQSRCQGDARSGVFSTVRHIISSAVEPARVIYRGGHLVGAPMGLLDEIFQAGRPVRVGLDTASTDCCVRNGAI